MTEGSLFSAIRDEDEARVKKLLKCGDDPNQARYVTHGYRPLHFALALSDSLSICESLIMAKADIQQRPRLQRGGDINLLRCCEGPKHVAKENLLLHHGIHLEKDDKAKLEELILVYPPYRKLLDAYRIMGVRVARCRRLCIALWKTPIQQHDLKAWWIREMVWPTRHDPIWTPDLPMPEGYT